MFSLFLLTYTVDIIRNIGILEYFWKNNKSLSTLKKPILIITPNTHTFVFVFNFLVG